MGSNPSKFLSCGDDCPVDEVSWTDIQDFIEEMNNRGEGTYRLPTDAEWEYACRAGSKTAFANGEITNYGSDPNLDEMGWYIGNSENTIHPVAPKKPNAWGLYDMHGNVFEWCSDWYTSSFGSSPVIDPTGPTLGSGRVTRGGSWFSGPISCRSAFRYNYFFRDWNHVSFGLRLVRLP